MRRAAARLDECLAVADQPADRVEETPATGGGLRAGGCLILRGLGPLVWAAGVGGAGMDVHQSTERERMSRNSSI